MEDQDRNEPAPPDTSQPDPNWTDADLASLLQRTVRNTALAGAAIAVGICVLAGWQTALLFVAGGAMSVGSIYEWGRMVRLVTARMDHDAGVESGLESGPISRIGTGRVIAMFLLRLVFFGGVIYVSLKCLHGSPIALICGLGLGVAGLAWEAIRTLRR